MITISNVVSNECNLSQYKDPIVIACKKFASQMTNILQKLKLQSNNLMANHCPLCCTSVDEILYTYYNPRLRSDSSFISMANKEDEQAFGNQESSFGIDYSDYMCSSCKLESKLPSMVEFGCNTDTNSSKSSSTQIDNDFEAKGLHPLFHPDSKEHNTCNIEPLVL